MPKPVIDVLEVVDVKQHHRESPPLRRQARDCGTDHLRHSTAVRQLGEIVRIGKLRKPVDGHLGKPQAMLVTGREIQRGDQDRRHDIQLDGEVRVACFRVVHDVGRLMPTKTARIASEMTRLDLCPASVKANT